MRLFCLSLFAGLAIMASPGPAGAQGFDLRSFETFVDARTGTGAPVYWYSVGTLRAYPSGELLASVEGYDTSRSDRPDPLMPLARQFSRKIYIYRDAVTNAVLRERNGMAVTPVSYPYQLITYELNGDRLQTFVEQGTGARLQRIGPGDTMQVRTIGDAYVFTAPLFLDFPVGDGTSRYQAFENYDFFIQAPGGASNPNQLSWVRYGDAPPWAGGGPAIMHLITWRIDAYDDVPRTLRDYIETDAPLWRAPPEGIDDIRRLQAGTPGE
jgi:hypothetical protein